MMLISDPGRCNGGGHSARRRWSCGFTLLEMLVVILVLGILTSLVTVLVQPRSASTLALEAERLARLLELAATESAVTGCPITWVSENTGYQFLRRERDAPLAPLGETDLLRSRRLPTGMHIERVFDQYGTGGSRARIEFAPARPPVSYRVVMTFAEERYEVRGLPTGRTAARAVVAENL